MKVEKREILISDLFDGYCDSGDNGIRAFHNLLNVRPAYQREFIYDLEKQAAVIDSVANNYPIGIMYWAKNEDDSYEIIDGQQRTISICRFLNKDFSVRDKNNNPVYADNEMFKDILDYTITVYICDGTNQEKLEWFKRININGEPLNEQELLNATYNGVWLTAIKKYFCKKGYGADGLAGKYLDGKIERQDFLRTGLKWISETEGLTIAEYMAKHQKDTVEQAESVKKYFSDVIHWFIDLFGEDNTGLWKKVEIGSLYNKYHNRNYDKDELRKQVDKLVADYDITRKQGVYEYILDIESSQHDREKYLSIRAFDLRTKREKYAAQDGKCAICGKPFKFEDMHADHITPWSKGGSTREDNCQMLCTTCNLIKSNKIQ